MKHFFHFTHICLIHSSLSEDWFSGFLTLRSGIDLQQLLSQETVALIIWETAAFFSAPAAEFSWTAVA